MKQESTDESKTQRRLREAVADLPEPYVGNRQRTGREALGNHLEALRARLDWLVKMEEQFGDEQKAAHFARRERNALIYALQAFAPLAIGEADSLHALPDTSRKAHDPGYVANINERIEECIAMGYTRAVTPGELRHRRGDDITPLDVPLTVWFAVKYAEGSR